jgi:hypothetical protein
MLSGVATGTPELRRERAPDAQGGDRGGLAERKKKESLRERVKKLLTRIGLVMEGVSGFSFGIADSGRRETDSEATAHGRLSHLLTEGLYGMFGSDREINSRTITQNECA